MAKYSAEFKQQVLAHMEQHQLSLRETVAYFDIRGDSGVVSRWRRLYEYDEYRDDRRNQTLDS